MYVIIIALLSMLACVLVAALISDPTLITQFGVVVWKLLGPTHGSPFFWMFTVPATILVGLFCAYWLWLHLTTPRVTRP